MREHSLLPAPVLRLARQQWLEQGTGLSSAIDARVTRSWQRSLAAGLSPMGRLSCTDNLSGVALQRARTQNHDLVNQSQPIMEYLFEQVRHSHSMVILSDPNGVLMHTLGDLDFLSKADRVALKCGASWHESQRGTNAIGTALAETDEVEIHGAEHYLDRNGFLTCAASPIVSATGALMGILDISGDHRSRHPHTLGLVSTAARMIENKLVLSACQHQIVLRLHARAEGIGSVAQGVLALSSDGWLVGANRRALEMLGLRRVDIGASQVHHVFDCTMDTLMASAHRAAGGALALHTVQGLALFATVQMEPHLSVRAQPVGTTPAPDALAQLDTGDVRWGAAATKARRVADKDIAVLLLGESGVGKELFAKALHDSSARKAGPFVAINCAALPEHLIESELFGYAPGAFTGARKQGSVGRLREAQGGTLFLDEIGDMPLAMQTRLLRVLQERQVTPLGCGETVAVDFALVCATHQNLREAADAGRFRSDLYYRINGLSLQLPALRERSDFAALTSQLLKQWGEPVALHIDPELLQALGRYRWPGNLRQYSNVLRTAAAMLEAHETCISWLHMPDDLVDELQTLSQDLPDYPEPPPQNLQQLSQKAIEHALENARGNVSAAARQLGISRQTMYRKLQGA